MISTIIEPYKLIVGWSPKCACTALKAGIMSSLDIEYSDIHPTFKKNFDDVTNSAKINTEIDREIDREIDTGQYLKVLFVRDPAKRFVSAVTNRTLEMNLLPYPYITTRNLLCMIHDYQLQRNSDWTDNVFFSPNIRHHFKQQQKEVDWQWDYTFNTERGLSEIFSFLSKKEGLATINFERMNHTETSEQVEPVFYGDIPFAHIDKKNISNKVSEWLDDSMMELVKLVYKEDYELLETADTLK